jgi:hypothetical protein
MGPSKLEYYMDLRPGVKLDLAGVALALPTPKMAGLPDLGSHGLARTATPNLWARGDR